MSMFRSLLGAPTERKTLDLFPLTWEGLFGAPSSKAGVEVSVDTALRTSAVLGCCRVLSEGIAQLPLKLYKEHDDGGKEVARAHPLYQRLWRRPNDWQTSFEWRESMMLHALLTHGGFSYKNRSSRTGEVLELIPIMPQSVRPMLNPARELVYELSDYQHQIVGVVPRTDMVHIRGPSWNTYSGLETVRIARDAIGLSIAQEESLSRLHSNGARPSGFLTTEAKLTPEQLKRIRDSFQEGYAGVQNAFKTFVLDQGLKYAQASLSPADTQTNESRRHQVEDVARFFRVFPHMIGYADKTATFASSEQFFIMHVIHSLGPWVERWEQVLARDLLSEDEVNAGYFFKLHTNAFLRGDAKSRAEFYASGIVNGWLTRNEARRLEDLDPIDGLDKPLVPLNMQPHDAASVDDSPQAKALAKAIAAELGLPHLEEKIGRVISAKNEKRLTQARDLVDEVLAELDKEEP